MPEKRKISRRTMAKGAAWTVPVIATAAAAPMAAASEDSCLYLFANDLEWELNNGVPEFEFEIHLGYEDPSCQNTPLNQYLTFHIVLPTSYDGYWESLGQNIPSVGQTGKWDYTVQSLKQMGAPGNALTCALFFPNDGGAIPLCPAITITVSAPGARSVTFESPNCQG